MLLNSCGHLFNEFSLALIVPHVALVVEFLDHFQDLLHHAVSELGFKIICELLVGVPEFVKQVIGKVTDLLLERVTSDRDMVTWVGSHWSEVVGQTTILEEHFMSICLLCEHTKSKSFEHIKVRR